MSAVLRAGGPLFVFALKIAREKGGSDRKKIFLHFPLDIFPIDIIIPNKH